MRVTELPRCGGVAVELAGRPAALTDAELAQLRHLLDTRGVLVVRPAVDGAGCESVEDFTAFCRSLGTLHDDVNGPGRGRPELRELGDEVHYISNLDLATDTAMESNGGVTHTFQPRLFLCLHLKDGKCNHAAER